MHSQPLGCTSLVLGSHFSLLPPVPSLRFEGRAAQPPRLCPLLPETPCRRGLLSTQRPALTEMVTELPSGDERAGTGRGPGRSEPAAVPPQPLPVCSSIALLSRSPYLGHLPRLCPCTPHIPHIAQTPHTLFLEHLAQGSKQPDLFRSLFSHLLGEDSRPPCWGVCPPLSCTPTLWSALPACLPACCQGQELSLLAAAALQH